MFESGNSIDASFTLFESAHKMQGKFICDSSVPQFSMDSPSRIMQVTLKAVGEPAHSYIRTVAKSKSKDSSSWTGGLDTNDTRIISEEDWDKIAGK